MASLANQAVSAAYEQLLHVDRNLGGNGTTHVSVKDGDNGTTFGFTIATDALMMTGANRLEFGDDGTYIHQSANGVLDLVSDTEIEINATTIDMNGALDVSSTLTMGGNITMANNTSIGIGDSAERIEFDGAGDISVLGANFGIGVSTMDTFYGSTSALQVEGLTHSTAAVSIFRDSNDVAGGWLFLGSSRGTVLNSDAIVQDGDNFGAIAFIGADNGDRDPVGAKIYAQVDGTPGSGDMPGRLVFGTTPSGSHDTTDRMVIGSDGTTDHKANYIVNEQGRSDHVANTMPAPYYRFDGVADYITLSSSLNLSILTCATWVKTSSTASSKLVDARDTGSDGFQLTVNPSGIVGGYYNNETATSSSTAVNDGRWHFIAWTYDGSTSQIYIDGVADGSSQSYTATISVTQAARIGARSFTTPSEYFDGEMSGFKFYNKALTATEVKELYSGASVPFKYKGANQTELITNSGFDSDTTGWTAYNAAAASISGGESGNCLEATNTADPGYVYQTKTLVIGKRYRFTGWIKLGTGTSGMIKSGIANFYTDSSLNFTTGDVSPSDWTKYTADFTANTATNYFTCETNGAIGETMLFDGFSVVQIGAVAEYDGSGVGASRWDDKSGNALHGTVTGATVENAPADADSGLTYEEGTWTPAIACSGSIDVDGSYNTMNYTKIGRVVHITGGFRLDNASSPSGAVSITGLPFTVADTIEESNVVAGSIYTSHMTGTVNVFQVKTAQNSTTLTLNEFAGTTLSNVGDHLAAGSRIALSITYLA